MKKFYIAALAVMATAMLSSCMQEKSFKDVKLGDNEVLFRFQGAAATRSNGVEFPTRQGMNLRIGREDTGFLVLDETITDLNALSPATRGTPAYTENVGVLYADNLGVYAAGFGDATYENMDDAIRDNGGWRYHHNYTKEQWAAGWATSDPAYFYLRMPADMNEHGVTLPETGYSDGSISFTYSSPDSAKYQRDILFAARELAQSELGSFRPEGAPVLFHHALSGVKFRIDNSKEDIQKKKIVKISSVAFVGLQNSGSCTVTPRKEPQSTGEGEDSIEEYKDNRTFYSSSDGTTVVWSDRKIGGNPIAQDYDYDGFITFTEGDGNNFAQSFYQGGQTMNVNAEDGSLTFWLVPQAFNATNGNDAATLIIKYEISDDPEIKVIELDFGKVLAEKNVEWKPGELRTYSLRIDDVNVMIDDIVAITNATATTNAYKGSTKTNVCIKNTGDTDAFIRAAIIGQWLDEYGDPVFGFSDFMGDYDTVPSWYQDQFGDDPQYDHGKFEGLVGYDGFPTAGTVWKWKKVGNYYYYTDPVEPGYIIGTAPADAEDEAKYLGYPLFTKYTVGNVPNVALATKVKNVWFELEISTQAISANKQDGTHYTLAEAWARAGVTIPTE